MWHRPPRKMGLAAISKECRYLSGELLIDDAAFDFHRRSQFAAINREGRVQQSEATDFLEVCKPVRVLVNLTLD